MGKVKTISKVVDDAPERLQKLARLEAADENGTDAKFWAVWRNSGGSPPQRRHDSKESAIQEAERLLLKTGEDYYVLEVVGHLRKKTPLLEYIDLH